MADKINLVKDSTMVKMANFLANAIRKYAPYEAIKKSVRIGKREGRGSSRFIEVLVGRKYTTGKHGAEYAARAFDIGSGIHGKFKATYPIPPKNARAIWFPYPTPKMYPGARAYVNNGVMGITTDIVNHPGVRGVGYTKKAMKEVRPKIRAELKKEVGNELRLYLKAKFSNLGGK